MLDRPIPSDIHRKGHLIHIRAGERRTAYHIADVLSAGNTVALDHNSILYRSRLIKTGPRHIRCETPPPIEASRGFKPGYYNGATLTGEDLGARYRGARIENDAVYLDRPVDPRDFPDADGDGRRRQGAQPRKLPPG